MISSIIFTGGPGWATYRTFSSPRSFNEHILSNKWRFRGDIELARRLTDKCFFKDWLREKGFGDLVVPTVGLYNSVEEIRNVIFEENTILKPTHLSGWVLPFHESRKLRVDELSKVKKWLSTDRAFRFTHTPTRGRLCVWNDERKHPTCSVCLQ